MICWLHQKANRATNTAAFPQRLAEHSRYLSRLGPKPGHCLRAASILLLIFAHSFAADSPKRSPEGSSAPPTCPTITLKKSARLISPRITLSQIAKVSAPPDLAAKIASIDIGRTPLPGRGRLITRGYIKIRLRAAGIDPGAFTFEGPEVVEVLGPQPRLQPRPQSAPANRHSAQTLPSKGPLPGQSDRGTVNGPKKHVVVVRRGEQVFVRASYGLVTVTATGRALEDGAVGDVIKIQVLRGKRLLARITGPHQAEALTYSQASPGSRSGER